MYSKFHFESAFCVSYLKEQRETRLLIKSRSRLYFKSRKGEARNVE